MSSPCVVPLNFPAAIVNRPSLPRIDYRIGRYSDFRKSMLSALDEPPLLAGWTHRQPDDPGIALIEGAAIVADILTFYQELYANEAWLRTASWPQSIAAIARLIGYRAAPGLGGTGSVAIEISGNSPVTIPQGLQFSAHIDGMPDPADFETSDSIVARPALSRMSLYAPTVIPGIVHGTTQFGVNPADLASAGVSLKANDRLMLVDAANPQNRQIAVITALAGVLDQTVVTIAGGWQGDAPASITAWKLGRTFRAFGYNAPANQFTLNGGSLTSTPVNTSISLNTLLEGFPLERQVNDLSAGITMLLELQVTRLHGGVQNRFESLTALAVKSDTDSVGPMQGGITRVAFEQSAVSTGPIYILPEFTDRRTAICHEVIGHSFPMAGVREVKAGADTSKLAYYGDGASYEALDGRMLQFVALNPDDTAARVEETTVSIDRSQIGDVSAMALRTLTLASALTQFSISDFPAVSPGVIAFGNVVTMTQGKTQPTAVLGSGDSRQTFQSFELPKAPLTWLLDESLMPPGKPQAAIIVNQIEWTEVDSFFASGPKDQVYILREDNGGNTWVQFGDGITGARLPSGLNNVTATYRTGNGANGWRQSGSSPQANQQIANLKNLRLYDQVTGGSKDEDPSHIRQTAPGRVEELGRVVSLSDFEFEALALPGVGKARAIWDIADGVPLVKVTVLLASNTPEQVAAVQTALTTANSVRGAARFPVLIAPAALEYVYLSIAAGLLPGYQSTPVLAAVSAALGVLPSDGGAAPEAGLFSVRQRSLGQQEYATRIEGLVQNVDGVAWVEVTALGPLGIAQDPSTLAAPSPPGRSPALSCANDRVLALYAKHFSFMAGIA